MGAKKIVLLIVIFFVSVAASMETSPIQQAFDRGVAQAEGACAISLKIERVRHFREKNELSNKTFKSCVSEYGTKTRPGFGTPPKNGYIFSVIASYASFVALKIVSIAAIVAISRKISKEQKIAAGLFAAAALVFFVIIYAMSGLKPVWDFYLSYGDKGTPFLGIWVYGLPTFLITFASFQFIWKRVIEGKKSLPFIQITVFITIVNIASFMSVGHIWDKTLKIIYPIHLVYLALLLAMLLFFGFKLKDGFLKSVDEHKIQV